MPLGPADDDVVPVQRVRDRLADPFVREDALRDVERDVVQADARAHHVGELFHALHILVVARGDDVVAVERPVLERDGARRGVRHELVREVLYGRGASVVVVESLEDEGVAALPRDHPVGPRAARIAREVGLRGLSFRHGPLADDREGHVGHDVENRAVGVFENALHGHVVDLLEAVDRAVDAARKARFEGSLEGEDRVVGRHDVAVVEFDALPEVKRHRPVVGSELPLFGKAGDEFVVVFRRFLDERVVDLVHHHVRDGILAGRGIERRRLRVDPPEQRILRARGRRGRAESGGTRRNPHSQCRQ